MFVYVTCFQQLMQLYLGEKLDISQFSWHYFYDHCDQQRPSLNQMLNIQYQTTFSLWIRKAKFHPLRFTTQNVLSYLNTPGSSTKTITLVKQGGAPSSWPLLI